MYYERLALPPNSETKAEGYQPSIEIEDTADWYVLFLCEANKDGRKLQPDESKSVKEVCDAFNGWLTELDERGFKVEISLNSIARNHLATQARTMNVARIDEWLVSGVGKILRTNSPLRVIEKDSGNIVHQAAYEEVVIDKIVLPSVRLPKQ